MATPTLEEKLTQLQLMSAPAFLVAWGERHPAERGAGSWIAVNDSGSCLALVNWYSVAERVKKNPISRGEIVRTAGTAATPTQVDGELARLPLDRINPFRLIGVFPATGAVIEWRWNLKCLARKEHRWKARQWISSGLDEPLAQRLRGRTFSRAWRQKSAGSLDWLRRLHRSHRTGIGPFSTCMHRADAATFLVWGPIPCTQSSAAAGSNTASKRGRSSRSGSAERRPQRARAPCAEHRPCPCAPRALHAPSVPA